MIRKSTRRGACLLGTIVGLSLGVGVQAASADVTVNWGTGLTAAVPANAAADPGAILNAISCPAVGSCGAVGQYQDNTGQPNGLVFSEAGGRWGTGVEALLPATANANADVNLGAVSCSSTGFCTALGSYVDYAGNTEGLIVGEFGGNWVRGFEVVHPQGVNVTTNADIALNSVSCPTNNSCAVVGTYLDNTGHPEGLLMTKASGTWSASAKAALPGDAGPQPTVALNSVSCPAAGECDAVGSYIDGAGHTQGLLLTETGGVWGTGIAASLPGDAGTNPSVDLTSVSCPAVGECDAVGTYQSTSGTTEGLVLTKTGGAWTTAITSPVPADAAPDPAVSLNSVSCASAGNCDAVGSYNDENGNLQGVLLTETGGTWAAPVSPVLPNDAGSTTFVQLTSVSCIGPANCSAAGNYVDDSFAVHPLLLSEATGSWGSGVEPSLPYVGSFPNADVESVSCAAGGFCGATVAYSDNANNSVSVTINGTANAQSNPDLALNAPPSTAEVGAEIPAGDLSATLTGSSTATGSVTFMVFGPQSSPPTSCAAGGQVVGTAAVQGDGTVSSSSGFVPSSAGTYWWLAAYNGDLANDPANSTCGASMASTIVSTPAVTIGAPATVTLDSAISAAQVNATLSDAATGATGTISFIVFGPQLSAPTSCGAGGTLVGTATVQDDGTYNPSADFNPAAAGNYWWYATYSGDSGNPPAVSTCGAQMTETVVPAPTTLTLNAPASTDAVGQAIAPRVSAALTGGQGEGGTVTFTEFGPQASPPSSCTSGGTTVGTATVNGDGTYSPADGFVPGARGDYWWYASYSGDAGNLASASDCGAQMAETAVVASPAMALSAPAGGVVGTAIKGSTVSAGLLGGAAETGTVTFTVYGPQGSPPSACTSGGTKVGTAQVHGDGSYEASGSFTPKVAGDYWWYAHYAGDLSNAASASDCGKQMIETAVVRAGSLGPGTSPVTTTLKDVKVHHNVVTLMLTCHGPSRRRCSDRLTLAVTETVSGGKVIAVSASVSNKSVRGVVTIGTATIRIATGKSHQLRLTLNRLGQRLLAARHTLTASLTVIQGQTFQTRKVTLHAIRKRHH